MSQKLTPQDCVGRLEDRREIKNLLGKYAVCHHLCRYSRIFEELWAQSEEDVSLGFNGGRYRGRESVQGYFTYLGEKTALGTRLLMEALPEAFAGKSGEESFGAGTLEFKPVQAPVIQFTEEGRAEAWWYSQGAMSEMTPAGPLSFWTWGASHAECIREGDAWKICKLDYFEDIKTPVGQSWTAPEEMEIKEEFAPLTGLVPPPFDEAADLHEAYGTGRPYQGVPQPEGSQYLDFGAGDLSPAESAMLQNIVDRDEIEQMMGLRVLCQINARRDREMEELWVRQPKHRETMSFGGTWGFYIGEEAVRRWYVDSFAKVLAEHPLGTAQASPLRSPAIQIAADGESAKGIWYSLGHSTVGGEAMWIGKKVAADFLKEDGRWKIWHILEVHDGTLAPGENFGDQNADPSPGEDPLFAAFGEPTVAVKTHEPLFCWTDDFPWMPEPYDTMLPEIEYSINGFQARREELRLESEFKSRGQNT